MPPVRQRTCVASANVLAVKALAEHKYWSAGVPSYFDAPWSPSTVPAWDDGVDTLPMSSQRRNAGSWATPGSQATPTTPASPARMGACGRASPGSGTDENLDPNMPLTAPGAAPAAKPAGARCLDALFQAACGAEQGARRPFPAVESTASGAGAAAATADGSAAGAREQVCRPVLSPNAPAGGAGARFHASPGSAATTLSGHGADTPGGCSAAAPNPGPRPVSTPRAVARASAPAGPPSSSAGSAGLRHATPAPDVAEAHLAEVASVWRACRAQRCGRRARTSVSSMRSSGVHATAAFVLQ